MRIRVYGALRELMGGAIHDMPVYGTPNSGAPKLGAETVGSVLERLVESHPELGAKLWDADHRLTGYITVLLNGRAIQYLEGLESPVTDADSLALFPPVGGGSVG